MPGEGMSLLEESTWRDIGRLVLDVGRATLVDMMLFLVTDSSDMPDAD